MAGARRVRGPSAPAGLELCRSLRRSPVVPLERGETDCPSWGGAAVGPLPVAVSLGLLRQAREEGVKDPDGRKVRLASTGVAAGRGVELSFSALPS